MGGNTPRAYVLAAAIVLVTTGLAGSAAAGHTGHDAECTGDGCTDTWTQSTIPSGSPGSHLELHDKSGTGTLIMHVTDADGTEVYTETCLILSGHNMGCVSQISTTGVTDPGEWTMRLESHGVGIDDASIHGWVDF